MRRVLRFLGRLVRWLLILGLILGLVGAVVGGWAYKKYVIDEPGPQLAREAIQAVIAQESPVLYRDNQTRVGVLFSQEHRQYVPYAEIPKAWVDAIIAAEDASFWKHPGVDVRGIARAMLQNVKAGRVVAGGSTLTQQTAKNLFYRPDRSWQSKLEEAANALRLEAHYSKEDILEFYANQFHVSANGRGLGIAARYFFDKDVRELTPLECAYLAGMVQAPARFNPFLADSEKGRAAARARARARTRYVLDRMLVTGALSPASHDQLVAEEIPFKRGTFRYDTSILLDEVAARLEAAPFPQLFRDLGIDNPSTAGVQIITTLDPVAQREATYALWHHLSEVGALLEKATVASLKLPADQAPEADPDNPPARHDFHTAVVRSADKDGIILDLGGTICVADTTALKRAATLLARAAKGETWKEASAADVEALAAGLGKGSVLWVSVREEGSCDLEFRPQLQGAMMLLEQGQIRAMVGGSDNRNFNRAVTAKRQLGSTWKPLVYTAALQLGWSPADALDNRPNAFPFEGGWYHPRPDHKSVDAVSLAWAGTRSENLASIWLLYHLTDRLEPRQFERVAALVGLAPFAGESREAYVARIRDTYGVISTADRVEELAFTGAKLELLADAEAGGYASDALSLRSLSYGRGAEAEEARVRASSSGADRTRKLTAVQANFLRLEARGESCAVSADLLREAARGGALPPASLVAELFVRPSGGLLRLACGAPGEEGWAPVAENLLDALAAGMPVPLAGDEDLLVGGRIHLGTLRALRRSMTRRALVLQEADFYSLETLSLHPDFRALVNLRYVAGLAARLGVRTELPLVLSLPLGAVDISVEEAATLYQGLRDGQAWRFPGSRTGASAVPGLRSAARVDSPDAPTMLIAEIRDRDGNLLYRASPAPDPVADPTAGEEVTDILRNVVRWGTGRRALGAVSVGGGAVPVAGKTGTTNGYKNAAFAGFVPRLKNGQWSAAEGFTLVGYVGYDDNRPMTRGGTRVQGASGALPAWIGTVQGLAEAGLLGEGAPTQVELSIEPGFGLLEVDGTSGLPLAGAALRPAETPPEEGEAKPTVLLALDRDGEVARRFAPWAAEDRRLARPEAAVAGPSELEASPALAAPAPPVEGEEDAAPAEEPPADAEDEAGEEDDGVVPWVILSPTDPTAVSPEGDLEEAPAGEDTGLVPRIAPPGAGAPGEGDPR